jgi:hypothetical protein
MQFRKIIENARIKKEIDKKIGDTFKRLEEHQNRIEESINPIQ